MKGLTLAGSPGAAGPAAVDDTTTDERAERAEPLATRAGTCCCRVCLDRLPNDSPLDVAKQNRAVPAGLSVLHVT